MLGGACKSWLQQVFEGVPAQEDSISWEKYTSWMHHIGGYNTYNKEE